MAYKLAGAARESLRKKVTRLIRESWAHRGKWFLPHQVDDATRDAIMFKEEQIEIRRKIAKEEAEKRRLQEAEQEHERQLKEEKAQRIARQEEIRMNEMRAMERIRLAEQKRLRGRRYRKHIIIFLLSLLFFLLLSLNFMHKIHA